MRESGDKLAAEIARIDSQMAALAKLKRQRLSKLSLAKSQDSLKNSEERREAIADVLAEAIVYLGERGLLTCKDEALPPDVEMSKGKTAARKKK